MYKVIKLGKFLCTSVTKGMFLGYHTGYPDKREEEASSVREQFRCDKAIVTCSLAGFSSISLLINPISIH